MIRLLRALLRPRPLPPVVPPPPDLITTQWRTTR